MLFDPTYDWSLKVFYVCVPVGNLGQFSRSESLRNKKRHFLALMLVDWAFSDPDLVWPSSFYRVQLERKIILFVGKR